MNILEERKEYKYFNFFLPSGCFHRVEIPQVKSEVQKDRTKTTFGRKGQEVDRQVKFTIRSRNIHELIRSPDCSWFLYMLDLYGMCSLERLEYMS